MRSSWHRDNIVIQPPAEGFRRFILTLSYDGGTFCGWQSQGGKTNPQKRSVQEELEQAIYKISGKQVNVFGSGRTDSGVHALGQVAHFDIEEFKLEDWKLRFALNANLPNTVRVQDVRETKDAFHSRFSTFLREYEYVIKSDKDFTAFDKGYVYNIKRDVDIDVLNALAQLIIGEDIDCKCFDFTPLGIEHSSMRDVLISNFRQREDRAVVYTICANAFLYHQVRATVGTFLELEKLYSKDAPSKFKEILKSGERVKSVAPAHGLYLKCIIYDEDEYNRIREGVYA